MWFGWSLISKRANEVNFRWSKKLRSMVKCGQIDQSKVAQKWSIALKSKVLKSKWSKESKKDRIYCKFHTKDEKDWNDLYRALSPIEKRIFIWTWNGDKSALNLKFKQLQADLNRLSIVPVGLDELVPSLKDGVGLVAGVELVVEAVLADKDEDEDDERKWPKSRPNKRPDAKTGPIRLEKGSF